MRNRSIIAGRMVPCMRTALLCIGVVGPFLGPRFVKAAGDAAARGVESTASSAKGLSFDLGDPGTMPVGVDDAGARKRIYDDPSGQAAFERIGFDFLMHHFWREPSVEEVDRLDRWAAQHGHGFLYNAENSPSARKPGDPAQYRKPGSFWQPTDVFVKRCLASPRFMGFCFDECEHWTTNGVWVTAGRGFMPQFYDAEGGTLAQAYAGNAHNLSLLMTRHFPGLAAQAAEGRAGPVVGTENVFPILQHLFARCGLVQMPKLLKETVTPVAMAMAMGAAKQYGVRHWTSVDLWGPSGYPGHTPAALHSALLLAYWTGSELTYIENFNYKGSLYATKPDGAIELSSYGKVARSFIRDYLPRHARPHRFCDFAPETIIVRFPDSDWGQENPGPWIRRNLYGASNLTPDKDTRAWLRIWHVITHDTLPVKALNYNTRLGIPYRVFFPASNVAVYDHLASDPTLYRHARIVFLVGKQVSPACRTTLDALVRGGLTVVSTTRLSPPGVGPIGEDGYATLEAGRGRWVVTDDVTLGPVRALLAPLLGQPDELRYVFGAHEVVFTADKNPDVLSVALRSTADGDEPR